MINVAEGGELCLTSGDHREPEDSDVYIKTSSPSLGFAERGGRGVLESVPFSSGSFQSPEVKHNSPPSATLHKQSFPCFLSYDAQRLYALWIRENKPVGFCVLCEFCGNYKQRNYK